MDQVKMKRGLLARIWTRLSEIPAKPGRWGKLLASILSFGWGVSISCDTDNLTNWVGVDYWVEKIGQQTCATVMIGSALIPMIGIAIGNIYFRIVGTSLALFVWILALGTAIAFGMTFRPATFVAIVCILGYANAEWRLAQQVVAGR